jgi:hypothetical protein
MRTYSEARALVGTGAHAVSSAGGWRRYIHFESRPSRILDDQPDSIVAARMFSTDIVTWHPDGRIVLDTGGWSTPSTFDGMAAALGIQRAFIGTRKHVPHFVNTPFDNPGHMTLTIHPEEDESGETELS